jgi:parallel beta-helix repeat protein
MTDCIEVRESEYNIIRGNALQNGSCGVHLGYWANHNLIHNNNITENNVGVYLSFSLNNTITDNIIQNSKLYGISILESTNSNIYHNNFMNNTQQTYDYSWNHPEYSNSTNFWDDSDSKGNYWSDYEEKYPNATELDGSGIWDTPYVIDENNQDNYPLIPELSAFILPLLMLATSLSAWVYKKKSKV